MIYLKIVERLRTQFLKHTYRGIPSVKRKNEEQLPGLQALECVCTVHLLSTVSCCIFWFRSLKLL